MIKAEFIQHSVGQYALTGVIGKKTVASLWRQRHILKPNNKKIVIDLVNIQHSDSAGLALLTCLLKEAVDSNHGLSFTNIPHQVQQLIELSHLEDILK